MKQVLDLLRREARLSPREIADRLGISEPAAAAAVRKLEDDGVIVGYQALVRPDKADDGRLTGIIEVKVTPERNRGFDAIARRIYEFPEVKLCYLVSGGYDLLVFVEGDSLRDVADFVAEKLATLEHVTSTTTHFILRKYKESGVKLVDSAAADRLPVSP
ncbi:MAG: Lrp/AsnC family transcriptional regulator [Candidatus Schekmanbacteria bacterium]|nr:Lrp/AsnC family transcriptional regulator [Candidatus Schekmanbacteria bacterium]